MDKILFNGWTGFDLLIIGFLFGMLLIYGILDQKRIAKCGFFKAIHLFFKNCF